MLGRYGSESLPGKPDITLSRYIKINLSSTFHYSAASQSQVKIKVHNMTTNKKMEVPGIVMKPLFKIEKKENHNLA